MNVIHLLIYFVVYLYYYHFKPFSNILKINQSSWYIEERIIFPPKWGRKIRAFSASTKIKWCLLTWHTCNHLFGLFPLRINNLNNPLWGTGHHGKVMESILGEVTLFWSVSPPIKQNCREWRPGIDMPDSEKVLESFLSLFSCIVSHKPGLESSLGLHWNPGCSFAESRQKSSENPVLDQACFRLYFSGIYWKSTKKWMTLSDM